MNHFHFSGRHAKAVTLTGHGDKAVAKFTLIRNQYAGKDEESGESLERTVAVQFTAFRKKAEAIAKNFFKGDQMVVVARVENNNYEKDGVEHFGFNFVVDDFDFGAPGEEKRAELAARRRQTEQAGA